MLFDRYNYQRFSDMSSSPFVVQNLKFNVEKVCFLPVGVSTGSRTHTFLETFINKKKRGCTAGQPCLKCQVTRLSSLLEISSCQRSNYIKKNEFFNQKYIYMYEHILLMQSIQILNIIFLCKFI